MSIPRPKLLGFMTWLMIITGALEVFSGIVVLASKNDQAVLDALDSAKSDVQNVGIGLIIAGAIGLLVAFSLRSAKNWARILVGVVAILNAILLIWAATSSNQVHWYNVVWATIIYLLIAGYLFVDDDVKDYFAQG